MFLGGLNKKSGEVVIEKYFSKIGEIEDILINRNMSDNSSKGCAFLLFKDFKVAQKLIQSKEVHIIEGNYVEVKQCYEKSKSKALKNEKLKRALGNRAENQGFNDMQFMNMFNNPGMGFEPNFMSSFMNNFVGNFTGFNQKTTHAYSQDLMQN